MSTPPETDFDLHAYCGTDAAKWAEQFCKSFPSALCQIPGREGVTQGDDFEDFVRAWFANAIMHTHDVITGNAPVVLPDGSAVVIGTVGD